VRQITRSGVAIHAPEVCVSIPGQQSLVETKRWQIGPRLTRWRGNHAGTFFLGDHSNPA